MVVNAFVGAMVGMERSILTAIAEQELHLVAKSSWRTRLTMNAKHDDHSYLRPGELRVLTMADLDVDAGLVHITKAWDYENEVVKTPKTRNGVRKVPAPATLLPLLARLEDCADPSALVVTLLADVPESSLADTFRAHLLLAGGSFSGGEPHPRACPRGGAGEGGAAPSLPHPAGVRDSGEQGIRTLGSFHYT